MKKIYSFALITAMLASIFTGCFSSDDEVTTPDADSNINGGQTETTDKEDNMTDEDSKDSEKMYEDGTYKAESLEEIDGYKYFVEIDIKDDKIEKVTFDGKNADEGLLTADQAMKDKYKEFDTSPDVFMPTYSQKLTDLQNVDEVLVIEGTEKEHEIFKKLANEALMNASKGEKEVSNVSIDN